MKSIKTKLVLNTVMSLGLQITTVVCGFILPRLLLGYYGSDVNGLIQSIAQFLGVISFMELGVGQVIQSNLYKPLVDGDNNRTSQVLKSGIVYFRKIAIIMLGYIIILSIFSPYIFDISYSWEYIVALIIAMGLNSLAQYYFGLVDIILLSADQRGYIQFASRIIVNILNVVIVYYLIKSGSSIQIVKMISAGVFLLSPIFVRCYVNKKYRINRRITYTEEPIKQKWNGMAQHIATVVLEGTDVIILTIFSSLSNVSIYSLYYMVISGVRQLYRSATSGIQSMVGCLWANNEREKLESVYQGVEILLHFVVVFLFSCIAILIVPFIRVYTLGVTDCDYIQPVFALVLTIAYAIRCLRTPYNILILAAGHYKQTQRCHIIAAVLNIVISIVSVSVFGLVGIAIGTLVAFAYQTVWMMLYTSKKLIKSSIVFTLKQVAIDVFTAGAIYVATFWIKMTEVSYSGWFVMALCVALISLSIIVIIMFLFYYPQLKKCIMQLREGRSYYAKKNS